MRLLFRSRLSKRGGRDSGRGFGRRCQPRRAASRGAQKGGELPDRIRHASCRCSQVRIACTGEPIRVSVCHCRECKARSGSAFAAQVRFPAEQVRIEGEAKAKMWQYTGDSGNTADFFFCGTCGSGVWYRARSEEHTSELQSLMRISYAVFCLKKKNKTQ